MLAAMMPIKNVLNDRAIEAERIADDLDPAEGKT